MEWIPAKPGEAAIICTGGTIDDRWLAEVVTREELAACGIRQARFTFDHTAYNMGGDWYGHDEASPNRGLSGEDKWSWTPGQFGKGILTEDGVLHGWGTGHDNDGDPIHDQYQNAHGLADASGTRFWLDREGNHYFYTVRGYVNHEPEEFGNHIREHLPNSQYMGIGYPPQGYEDDEAWESEPSSSRSYHEAKHDITASKGDPLLVSQASDTDSRPGSLDFGHVYYDYSHGGESGEDKWSWTPGQYGKGVLTEDGILHGWRTGQDVDGQPWHTRYEQTHGISEGSPNGQTRFRITPEGHITGYSLPAYRNHSPKELMHYVNQHLPNAQHKSDPIQGWNDDDWQSPSPQLVSKVSHWDDIMAKAKRLIQSGNVTLLRNGYNNIVAHVIGDHGEYQCEISRDDPNSRAITQWTCECPWDQYAFQRTRQWKKYEARPCAHVLAAYWKSQGTQLDEDAPPGASPAGGVPGQTTPFPPQGQAPLSPFAPQMPQQGPEMGLQPGPDGGAMPGLPPAAQMTGPPQLGPPSALPPVGNPPMQPDALNPAFMAPAQTGLIPPFPLEPAPQPVSVPGARPGPYPANPVQQPGTFSKVGAREHFDLNWDALDDMWRDYKGDRPELERALFGVTKEEWPEHHRQMQELNQKEDTSLHGFGYDQDLHQKYLQWAGLNHLRMNNDAIQRWHEHGPHWRNNGFHGKGIIYDDGTVHTWTTRPRDTWNGVDEVDGEPGHEEYIQDYGIDKTPVTALWLAPGSKGTYSSWYSGNRPQHPNTEQLLQQAHPDVQWHNRWADLEEDPAWADDDDAHTFSHVHLAAPPKIVEQGLGFQGLHDAAFPIGYGFPTKPVAYDHNDNTIYIGGEGEYHGSLRLPNQIPVQQTGRVTKDGYLHWYYHNDPSRQLVADALGVRHLEEQEPYEDLDWEDQTELANQPNPQWQTYTARVAAEFVPDSRARLNEATLGQSEGREGATDAGRWMEIPEGANVEIVYQDPSTGWVEIRYPLKGGPMTSYHVTCFVEPEKLAPLPGDSPMAPRRRR